MRTNVALTVEAVAVAIEDAPPYSAVGQYPTDPEQLLVELGESTDQVPDELRLHIQRLGPREAAVMIDLVGSVVRATNIPMSAARMLTIREDGAELAEVALTALGPPPRPQPLFLVQTTSDRDTSAMLLPKLVHELDWHVTEELGITHLGGLGGTAILDMLSWSVDPHIGATVIVADQPHVVTADHVPNRLLAVALRFGGDGPLEVLDWGEGRPPAGADQQFTGSGACGGWPDLHAALGNRQLRTGNRIVVQSGAGDQLGWALLRYAGEADGRPAWWRSPVRLGGLE
jgi:hypothetical protein